MNFFTFRNVAFLVWMCAGLLNSQAQDWNPMQMGERYNYQQDSAGVITQTLWADSQRVVAGDSVWYSNMTYALVADSFRGRPDAHLVFDAPFFLQKTIQKIASGHYQFSDTGFFDLPLFQKLGTTWLFDTLHRDSATIIATGDSLLWGTVRDSVKYIQLQSGGNIIASKSHGILEWNVLGRQMKLVGMQGNKVLGEQVPMFDDFYKDAFTPGDEMYWAIINNATGYFTSTSSKYIYQQKDNSRPDTIQYVFDELLRREGQFIGSPSFSQSQNNRGFAIDSADHSANAWPGQMANSYPFGGLSSTGIADTVIAPVMLTKDKDGRYYKSIGIGSVFVQPVPLINGYERYFPLINETFINERDSLFRSRDFFSYVHTYGEVVGFFSWVGTGFEFSRQGYCSGYIQRGDTILGIVQNERTWWPTSIENEVGNIPFSIYPNPISGLFNIKLKAANQPGTLTLLDLHGKSLVSWSIQAYETQKTLSIPASVMPGMYMLQLEKGNRRGVRRLLVR
ncbi:MAG: T9SS type A sorting domain-containing protein [Bacteroidia bacterium]